MENWGGKRSPPPMKRRRGRRPQWYPQRTHEKSDRRGRRPRRPIPHPDNPKCHPQRTRGKGASMAPQNEPGRDTGKRGRTWRMGIGTHDTTNGTRDAPMKKATVGGGASTPHSAPRYHKWYPRRTRGKGTSMAPLNGRGRNTGEKGTSRRRPLQWEPHMVDGNRHLRRPNWHL